MDTKICSKCNKELPLNSFRKKYKSEERADTCKSCCTELLSKGYKVCSRCNNVYFFTIEYFNSDKTKKSGFDNTCRTCTGIKIKTWSNENREKVCAHASAYLQTDKGKIRNRQRRRLHEARKLSLPSTFTNTQWEQTKLYFNNVCCYCGEKLTLEQDHFIALSKNGEYTVNNIVPSCRKCNSSKHDASFFNWYPVYVFYDKTRENRILKYLQYNSNKTQQLSIF